MPITIRLPRPASRRCHASEMAILLSCWFIIENVLIRPGLDKWYCLSLFIHPLLLVICQIFLWIKWLGTWISVLVLLPVRRIWDVILLGYRQLRSQVILAVSPSGSVSYEVQQEYQRCEVASIPEVQRFVLSGCYRIQGIPDGPERSPDKRIDFEEEEDNKGEESDVHVDEDLDKDEASSGAHCPESPIIYVGLERKKREEEIDGFYQKYTERMRWFDLINYERTCGISAILNKQLGNSSLLQSIEPLNLSLPCITWSKVARRKLIRSLESDFEMVYVGQSCLCWEALHHQYRKVAALAFSNSSQGAFYNDVCGKFQQFQVLLERFMENERVEGKRYWNYVQGRFSLNSLLQVPEVSGYGVGEGKEGMKGQAILAREVVKAIEKCIITFEVFLKTDNKKSSWKLKSLLWTYPQVEDPKDLGLLADLIKAHQKKELRLKDLQKSKRCLLKKADPFEESHKMDILFSMIDLKLVARVLRMSVISTQQLNWCQEKLSNLDIVHGKVVRASNSCLFPP